MRNLIILLFLFSPLLSQPVYSLTRCQCSYQDWQGDCRAKIEQTSTWFKVVSDTQQCSRVDWYINGEPQVTIVTDGADMVEWLGQSEPQSLNLTIQSCKICKDSQISKSIEGNQCSYRYREEFGPEKGTYSGQCLNGIAHGKGRISFPSGAYMEGTFVNGEADGPGEYQYAGGSKYVGQFENSIRKGRGVYYFNDGSRYEGEFDKFINGYGVWHHVSGGRDEGYFENNKLFNGTRYYADRNSCVFSSGRRTNNCCRTNNCW